MDEIEEIGVEVLPGERPSSTLGERLMIGLAALALVGGVLIATGNLLGGLFDNEGGENGPVVAATAGATPSARPSRTPRPTPTPRPLRELTLDPGEPPDPVDPFPAYEAGWVEAIGELIIHNGPSVGAEEAARLQPGEVVRVELLGDIGGAEEGWLRIEGDGEQWVRIVDDAGEQIGVFHRERAPRYSGGLVGLVGGGTGFMAVAWDPIGPEPHGLRPPEAFTAFSPDGSRWTRVDAVRVPWGGGAVAWGPSGWLAADLGDWSTGATVWIAESSDGRQWTSLGSFEPAVDYWGLQFAGSDLGYLLLTGPGTRESTGTWFSPDGITWQESHQPLGEEGTEYVRNRGFDLRIAASPDGFLVWSPAFGERGVPVLAAYSANGRDWEPISAEGDIGLNMLLGFAGGHVLGLSQTDDGSVQAWRADLAARPLTLRSAPELETTFRNAVVTNLSVSGGTAYAVGYELGSERSLVWSSDGTAWSRLSTPAAGFGAIPSVVAAGPTGLLVGTGLGGFMSPAIDAELWRRDGSGTWSRVEPPLVEPLAPPTAEECGQLPTTALGFMILDATMAPECFGRQDMTFRAWSAPCDWCGQEYEGEREPAWLAEPSQMLLLAPMRSDGWWRDGILAPGLEWSDDLTDTWIEVTGHYDDPAAQSCRWETSPGSQAYYAGREVEIETCRQRFVLTAVTPVEGPHPTSAP